MFDFLVDFLQFFHLLATAIHIQDCLNFVANHNCWFLFRDEFQPLLNFINYNCHIPRILAFHPDFDFHFDFVDSSLLLVNPNIESHLVPLVPHYSVPDLMRL